MHAAELVSWIALWGIIIFRVLFIVGAVAITFAIARAVVRAKPPKI